MLSLLCILCAGAWPMAIAALAFYGLSLQPKPALSALPMLFLTVALLSFSACAAEDRVCEMAGLRGDS